jgi:hypothetical protein
MDIESIGEYKKQYFIAEGSIGKVVGMLSRGLG